MELFKNYHFYIFIIIFILSSFISKYFQSTQMDAY